jgi:hypothetical protein
LESEEDHLRGSCLNDLQLFVLCAVDVLDGPI